MRTLDAGADKPLPALPMPEEANPFLGVRGIRLTLERRDVLATQLRAILRVAAEHPVKVMLPMVATVDEIHAARAVLEQARADTGIDAPLEFGIMVEIPAAALTARRLAEHVDFFSIGTNDLTQYTMAAERGDERLAPLLTGPQPAVLRLVQATVEAAASTGAGSGCAVSSPAIRRRAVLFVGLGVTELSMAPALVPEVKAALRGVDSRAGASRGGSGARDRQRGAAPLRLGLACCEVTLCDRGSRYVERVALIEDARGRHRAAGRAVPLWSWRSCSDALVHRRRDRVRDRGGHRLVRRPAGPPLGGHHAARGVPRHDRRQAARRDRADRAGVGAPRLAMGGAVIVGREFTILGLRAAVESGGRQFETSMLGKWKATVQFVAITLAILRPDVIILGAYLDQWAMVIAAIVTAWSGIDYIVQFSAALRS